MEREKKVWGHTTELFRSDTTSTHSLKIKAGGYCSEHRHAQKRNTFFVIDGELEIIHWENGVERIFTTLKAGDACLIDIDTWHKFKAIVDTNCIEIYDYKYDDVDIERRVGGGLDCIKFPLVVSYYTERTGYVKEAQKLKSSLNAFGIEYDIRGIKNSGNWRTNANHKPRFIRGMMDKYPDRNILWLDADHIVRKRPGLFDNVGFDIGIHEIDWSKYSKNKPLKQFACGTIYVRNSPHMRGFMNMYVWVRDNAPEKPESLIIKMVLGAYNGDIKLFNLPPAYCQIFDLMKSTGKPVIEAMQASRRFKEMIDH